MLRSPSSCAWPSQGSRRQRRQSEGVVVSDLKQFVIDKADAQKLVAALEPGDLAFIVWQKQVDGEPRVGWNAIGDSTMTAALGMASFFQQEVYHGFMELEEDEAEA